MTTEPTARCTCTSTGLNPCATCPRPWPSIPGATSAHPTTQPEPPTCPCCTFGNHAEPCTCSGSSCCHPAGGGPGASGADQEAPDDDLTAEEARALVDELGRDLYRAQDALAFAREMCDIADRNGTVPTTARVRRWLEGVKCGRQMIAEAAAPAGPDPAGDGMRERYAAAIRTAARDQPCTCGSTIFATCCHPGAISHEERRADAVLAVRDGEMERLAEEAATARRTQWDEFRVLAAELRTRAEAAEARIAAVEAERDGWAEALNNLLRIDKPSAAIARIRQMADAWEQQLPDTIRTATAVDAIRTALDGAQAGQEPTP